MKIPRDIDGNTLVRLLETLGYSLTRQKGSHIRLTRTLDAGQHHITIPNHSPIKIGTLNSILNEVADKLKISKQEVLSKLH